ncbi:helix-turn-helix domain-containing protein [Lacrimispora sp.]|uniref:helix-turn-helix domain-containing protein n=1 Tax=Lacrimispora sp. TaxID=2719234 RepID=UPI00345F17C6
MDNEAVLRKIEEINQSRNWSMYKLSKESGIAQSTLSSLFGRRANISLPKLFRICEAFSLKVSDFFALLEEDSGSESSCSHDYEIMEMIQKASTLSEHDRRLLRTIIIVMEQLEKEQLEKKQLEKDS